jgi:hypothetical protein
MIRTREYTLDEYWRAVRKEVCAKCVDGDGWGNCRLTDAEACGLKVHFRRIVETVLSVESDDMAPYVDALRKNVCSDCKHQSPDGTCTFRTNIDCGLDRYFPLVVEAIEQLHTQSA